MKKSIVILASVLTSLQALAGGGGAGSPVCGFAQVTPLRTKICDSSLFQLRAFEIVYDNFADAGNRCPRGGQHELRVELEINVKQLVPDHAAGNPLSVGFIDPKTRQVTFTRDLGMSVTSFNRTSQGVDVEARIAEGPNEAFDLRSIAGKTFGDHLICH